jgi:hypothetical protein
MPAWALKAEKVIEEQKTRIEQRRIYQTDSEIHEFDAEELEDEKRLSSLFVDHDPSQCFDKSETWRSYMNFIEDKKRTATTILDDSNEDIPIFTKEKKSFCSRTNPLAGLKLNTLRYLASQGDELAKKALEFKENNLARKLDVVMTIERGEVLRNGNLVVHKNWADEEAAQLIRNGQIRMG